MLQSLCMIMWAEDGRAASMLISALVVTVECLCIFIRKTTKTSKRPVWVSWRACLSQETGSSLKSGVKEVDHETVIVRNPATRRSVGLFWSIVKGFVSHIPRRYDALYLSSCQCRSYKKSPFSPFHPVGVFFWDGILHSSDFVRKGSLGSDIPILPEAPQVLPYHSPGWDDYSLI